MIDLVQVMFAQEFLRNAMLAALLASVGCGVMGTFVVVKRIGYMAGGIAHTVLGGMGVAYFLGADPLLGAMVAAILAALTIGWVSLRWHQHEDVIIGALWAVGMAVGILFIARTPGYNVDLMGFLFGSILMVTREHLYGIAALDGLVVSLVVLFYKQFVAICFDEEFARIRGVNVTGFYLLLLCLVAVTVVSLIQIVGLVLVIALFTLPAATAGQLVRSVARMMFAACVLGGVLGVVGLAVSYQTDLPSGATIILLVALVYLATIIVVGLRRRA